jgi:hypothetical protein
MKRKPEDYARLRLELERELTAIDVLFQKNRKATERIRLGGIDELDWAALGFTIHNLYCAFESYFLRIAKMFENGLEKEAWHRELVDRMTLEIPNLRPRLFPVEYARRMDELRRFRHAFRNVYQSELDPRRLGPLNDDIPALVADFHPYHERFIETLGGISSLMEKGEE